MSSSIKSHVSLLTDPRPSPCCFASLFFFPLKIVLKAYRNCLTCSLQSKERRWYLVVTTVAAVVRFSIITLRPPSGRTLLISPASPSAPNSKQTNSVGQQMVSRECPSVVPPHVTLPFLHLPHACPHTHMHAPAPPTTSLPAFSSALPTKHLIKFTGFHSRNVWYFFLHLSTTAKLQKVSARLVPFVKVFTQKAYLPF